MKSTTIRLITISILTLSSFSCTSNHHSVSQYDIVWDSPSENAKGSMPLGNGEIGINVWAEKTGDLYCYLGRTDAWNGNGSLLKVGKVRIHITPNPFVGAEQFEQRLDLQRGEIRIQTGSMADRTTIRIWVDANNPVVQVDMESEREFELNVSADLWRTAKRELFGKEKHTAYGIINSNKPIYIYPDSILTDTENEIIWVHRNHSSIWDETLNKQGMSAWIEHADDPLIRNTFGGLIRGDHLQLRQHNLLMSKSPAKRQRVSVYAYTGQASLIDEWRKDLDAVVARADNVPQHDALKAHYQYWNELWKRSWIRVNGTAAAHAVSQSYVLQRFISACAGRGNFPQKFNGSLFTVDTVAAGYPYDADFRMWGGPYWLQNTRLIYWPMLYNGDFDMMQPFFKMYLDALPYAKAATQRFYGHRGAFFPETMYFWGSYNLDNFGWNTSVDPFTHVKNGYIRYYFQGALEASAIMLEYYRYTLDPEFARNTLLPFAEAVVRFYSEHYPRDENGKMKITPSQALETYWEATNPAPPVAGLIWNVTGVLEIRDILFEPGQRQFFEKIANELPELTFGTKDGKDVVLPAAHIAGSPKNHENPEAYAIFPYRLFGVGKPELERMRNSYKLARVKAARGWQHYDLNAAFLGFTDDAKTMLLKRVMMQNPDCRFPAFWGPNFDWVPDQDHGNNILLVLQTMLLQTNGDTLMLFPAWPKEWDVQFKIHAPKQTVLQGELKGGELVKLAVTPISRRKDVVIMK